MEITATRVKIVGETMRDPKGRLLGFATTTLDHCFVIRDLKIIESGSEVFVAMPSRKISVHCPHCQMRNHRKANFCNECGNALPVMPIPVDDYGRPKLYADIAHPICQEWRVYMQKQIILAYGTELHRSRQPGYVCSYDVYEMGHQRHVG